MPLSISKTLPFRHLLSRIGYSTYRFNTILVGLDCVAKGGGDGGSIAVTWTKPKNKQEAESAASKARSFACAGAIVFASDVFDYFLREIAEEAWLEFKPTTVEIATKARTRKRELGSAYSVAERAEALASDLGIDDPQALALIDLFAKWRNVVAHTSDRSSNLDGRLRKVLAENADQIAGRHSNLRVALAVKNFEARSIPVPKEVTSLMANAVRFARVLDESAIRRVASTPEGIEVAADRALTNLFKEHGAGASSIVADAFQGSADRRLKVITKWLASRGISESKEPISATLPETYASDLAALSREQFTERYIE
jgi:hypothetical protein